MTRIPTNRNEVEGGEYDWFAVDAFGHVGHFATAGLGPIPVAVLARLFELWDLDERVSDLPVVGKTTGHLPGRIDDWLEMARRGLFAYDWQHSLGPYRRAATPSIPVLVADLPAELGELLQVVKWPGVRFAETLSLRPDKHCPCE